MSENKNDISVLINIFKNCLKILRDNEKLTEVDALRNISNLIILKMIEPHFGKEIDIDGYNYDTEEKEKTKLLEIVRFSNLIKEKEDNLPNNIQALWDNILSVHPYTKKIYVQGEGFNIKNKSTFKKLFNKLEELPVTDVDILGNAYEEIIKDTMTKKQFGQFFTQPLIKKLMVKLIEPVLYQDGKIDTCADPTMGTGGFLITYMEEILKQSKENNIKIDWDYVKKKGLYGKEIEPSTYQLAVSNMLISSGHMFDHLEKGDSIKVPITRKFDNILSNPPFAVKIGYDSCDSSIKDEYIPIKTDNSVLLFLQAVIYMLKIEGKCAIVLPDGQELFSKTNKTYVAIREYLVKTCDLKEIIYLPQGIFNYTSIKTCVFFFVKKLEGVDIVDTTVIVSKTTKKEKGRNYVFVKEHQTKNVKFYEYDPVNDNKKLLINADIEKISKNGYSLNYSEYIENVKEDYKEGIETKTLGEVCEIDYGTRIVKSRNGEGEYPVYGSGRATFTTDTFNREGYNILIGRFALSKECVRIIYEKIYLNDSGLSVKPKNNNILHKYIGYYILSSQNIIYECARGTAQKNLDMEEFKNIKIPVPSLEKQKEIVDYLDYIYEKTNKTSTEKITELKKLNEYCIKNKKIFGTNETKTLGEVCDYDIGGTPLRSNNDYYENGTNLWVSVKEMKGGYIYDTKEKLTDLGVKKSSVKLFKKDTVLFSFKLSIGKTAIVGSPLYTNKAITGINSKDENVLMNKYIYFYLSITDFTKFGSGMLGNGSMNKTSLGIIEIPVPSLEKQKEIVEYCDYNCKLIEYLEKEIESNKKQAHTFFMKNI